MSHKWNHITCGLLWLACFLSMMFCKVFYVMSQYFIFCFCFFFWQVTFHCTDLPHLIYLCISWWTFGFFPLLWIMLLWMLVCKFLCGHMFSIFLVYIKVALLGHTVLLCEELPVSRSGCTILHLSWQCVRVTVFPYPCQHLLISVFLNNSRPTESAVASHCGFDMHFPDGWWCWASLLAASLSVSISLLFNPPVSAYFSPQPLFPDWFACLLTGLSIVHFGP